MDFKQMLMALIGTGVNITAQNIQAIEAAINEAIKTAVETATKPIQAKLDAQTKLAEEADAKLKAEKDKADFDLVLSSFGFKKEQYASVIKFIDKDKWDAADENGKKLLVKDLPKTTAGIVVLPENKGLLNPKLKTPAGEGGAKASPSTNDDDLSKIKERISLVEGIDGGMLI